MEGQLQDIEWGCGHACIEQYKDGYTGVEATPLDKMKDWEQEKKDDIAPILKGIDARLAVLDSLWDPSTIDSEVDDHLFAMFERPSGSKSALEADGQGNDSPSSTQNASLLVSISNLHAANIGHSKRPS
jgi:hypothetical protein